MAATTNNKITYQVRLEPTNGPGWKPVPPQAVTLVSSMLGFIAGNKTVFAATNGDTIEVVFVLPRFYDFTEGNLIALDNGIKMTTHGALDPQSNGQELPATYSIQGDPDTTSVANGDAVEGNDTKTYHLYIDNWAGNKRINIMIECNK